jgi:hypothetical protein
LIGEIDVEIESGLNFANIKADPLNPIFHWDYIKYLVIDARGESWNNNVLLIYVKFWIPSCKGTTNCNWDGISYSKS